MIGYANMKHRGRRADIRPVVQAQNMLGEPLENCKVGRACMISPLRSARRGITEITVTP